VTGTTQPMLSNSRLSYSNFQGLRAIGLLLPGYRSEGMMSRWQATLYVLLMTSASQDRVVSEFRKQAMPSAQVRVSLVYRTLYECSGHQMGRDGEHGPV
jgi:hypothetical protein